MINKEIKKLIKKYQQQQWEEKNRDLGFFKARCELLSCGAIAIYKINSSDIINIKDSEGVIYPSPMIANVNGVFTQAYSGTEFDFDIKEPCTIQFYDKCGFNFESVSIYLDETKRD